MIPTDVISAIRRMSTMGVRGRQNVAETVVPSTSLEPGMNQNRTTNQRPPPRPARTPLLFVVSGTYWEFTNFCKRHNLRNGQDARYVQNENAFRGFRRDSQFIRTGTWWNRPDGDRIFDMLVICGMQEIESMTPLIVRNLVLIFRSGRSYVNLLDLP
jgi:hypothetical protein